MESNVIMVSSSSNGNELKSQFLEISSVSLTLIGCEKSDWEKNLWEVELLAVICRQ